MKKQIILITLLVSLSGLTHCFSQDLASAKSIDTEDNAASMGTNIIQGKDDRFAIKIIYENYISGKVTVELSSIDGNVSFFKETRSDAKYMRTFNMGNLPAGEYKIELNNGKDKYSKKITIASLKGKRSLTLI